MSPSCAEGDDLPSGMDASVSAARPDDPDRLLVNRCQRPLYLPLNRRAAGLLLEAEVVGAIVLNDGHESLDAGLRFLY